MIQTRTARRIAHGEVKPARASHSRQCLAQDAWDRDDLDCASHDRYFKGFARFCRRIVTFPVHFRDARGMASNSTFALTSVFLAESTNLMWMVKIQHRFFKTPTAP